MTKKKYHKGILCQLGFHKWGKSEANMVFEGKSGKIIARICDKCGHKNDKGHFVADEQMVSATATNQKTRVPDNKNDGIMGSAGGAGGVGGKHSSISMNVNNMNGVGYIVENGKRRLMTEDDKKKLDKELKHTLGQLEETLKGLNADDFDLEDFLGSPKVNLGEENYTVKKSTLDADNGYNINCTCRKGKWNEKGTHCQACKKKVRT